MNLASAAARLPHSLRFRAPLALVSTFVVFLASGCLMETEGGGGPPPDAPFKLGYLEGADFQEMTPGGALRVVNGSQGGTWAMPALRCRGFDTEVRIEGTVYIGGEAVGEAGPSVFALDPLGDGWSELPMLPIRFERSAIGSVDDLDGRAASVELVLEDGEGGAASGAFPVTVRVP